MTVRCGDTLLFQTLPVIVYGTLAAVVYGAVLWVLGMAGVPVLS